MISTSAFSSSRGNVHSLGLPRQIATMSEPPGYDWGEEITKSIEELMQLENGWDGYNAQPVSFRNASFALEMLKAICDASTPKPNVFPGVDGDLQIEWHSDTVDIELHIVAPYEVYFWTNDEGVCPNGDEIFFTNTFIHVQPMLRKLTEVPNDRTAATG